MVGVNAHIHDILLYGLITEPVFIAQSGIVRVKWFVLSGGGMQHFDDGEHN